MFSCPQTKGHYRQWFASPKGHFIENSRWVPLIVRFTWFFFFFIICWFPGDFFAAFVTICPPKWFIRIVVYCDCSVGVCSSNSHATRRGTRNLIYTLALILLNLLTTSTYYLYSTSPSSGIVAVLIAKAGHVYCISYRYLIATGLLLSWNRLAYAQLQLISTKQTK